jgi:hypothetical protein
MLFEALNQRFPGQNRKFKNPHQFHMLKCS